MQSPSSHPRSTRFLFFTSVFRVMIHRRHAILSKISTLCKTWQPHTYFDILEPAHLWFLAVYCRTHLEHFTSAYLSSLPFPYHTNSRHKMMAKKPLWKRILLVAITFLSSHLSPALQQIQLQVASRVTAANTLNRSAKEAPVGYFETMDPTPGHSNLRHNPRQ